MVLTLRKLISPGQTIYEQIFPKAISWAQRTMNEFLRGTIERRKAASLPDIISKLFSRGLLWSRLFTHHSFGCADEWLQFDSGMLSGSRD
jgi:hypothetical protein